MKLSIKNFLCRIVELIELQFTESGVLAGGTVELALPDTHRLNRTGMMQESKGIRQLPIN